MRVILTQPVNKLGSTGDVCNVANGYGRNYLLPQGLAILASPGALRQIDDIKRVEAKRQDHMRGEMQGLAGRIEGLQLSFEARVGAQGRLYGSITAADIAQAIEAKLGEAVDRRKIHLDDSIRTLGEHSVNVHLMPGVDAKVTINVVPDAESAHLVTSPATSQGGAASGQPMADASMDAETETMGGMDTVADVDEDLDELDDDEGDDDYA